MKSEQVELGKKKKKKKKTSLQKIPQQVSADIMRLDETASKGKLHRFMYTYTLIGTHVPLPHQQGISTDRTDAQRFVSSNPSV